jgi:hypothetical protein
MIFGSCCAAHFSPFRLGVAGSDFCSCLDLIPFRRFHLHLFPPVSLRLVHVLASSLIDPSAQFCSPVREIVPSEADSPLLEQTAFRRQVFIFPDRAFLLPSVSGVHFVFYLHHSGQQQECVLRFSVFSVLLCRIFSCLSLLLSCP